jgi:hypothetical protein
MNHMVPGRRGISPLRSGSRGQGIMVLPPEVTVTTREGSICGASFCTLVLLFYHFVRSFSS